MDIFTTESDSIERARIRRSWRSLGVAGLTAAVIAYLVVTVVSARHDGTVVVQPAADPALVPAVSVAPAAEPVVFELDNPAESGPPPSPAAAAAPAIVEVPDPRPGDMRSDPSADALPVAYAAAVPRPTEHAYGTDPAQRLDLYLPAGVDDAPLVVYVHGGGWVTGDKDEIPQMVLRFVEQGYAVAAVNYRLAPQHPFPAQIHDVKRAIRWLKELGARDVRFDAGRIVAYGISAGGHLATLAAATPGSFEPPDLEPELAAVDSSVAGVVSVVGITDLVQWSQPSAHEVEDGMRGAFLDALMGGCPCDEVDLVEISPLRHLGPDLPPAYFAYGGQDNLVDWEGQGAAAAAAWSEHAGAGQAWFDLVDDSQHNVSDHLINQRAVELFVASVAG